MKALNKDLSREIKKNFPRFLSILLLVGLGVMVLVGLASTGPTMRYNMEKKLQASKMYDLFISNSLGLTDEDVQTIANLDQLRDVEFRYSMNRRTEKDGDEIHLLSLTTHYGKPILVQGKLPDQEGEIALDQDFAKKRKLHLGDRISFKEVKDKYEIQENKKPMTRDSFVLVGLLETGEYLQTIHKGSTPEGTAIDGLGYVDPDVFSLKDPTDALIVLRGTENLATWSKDYEDKVLAGRHDLEDLFNSRPKARLEEMEEDIQEEIDQGQEEIQSGRDKLQAAKDQLVSARKKLDQGKKDYQKGRDTFQREIAQGESKLRKGQKDLAQGEEELRKNKGKLEDGEKKLKESEKLLVEKEEEYRTGREKYVAGVHDYRQGLDQLNREEGRLKEGQEELRLNEEKLLRGQEDYEKGLKKLEDGALKIAENEKKLDQGRKKLDQGYEEWAKNKEKLDQAQGAIDSGRRQLQGAKDQASQAVAQREKALADLKASPNPDLEKIDQLEGEVEAAKDALDKANQALEAYDKQVAPKQAEVDLGKKKLEEGKKTLDQEEAKYRLGLKQLNQGKEELERNKGQLQGAKKQLEDGFSELNKGKTKLEDGQRQLKEGKAQLDDSYLKLQDAREALEDGKIKLEDGKKSLATGKDDLASGKEKYAQGLEKLKNSKDQLQEASQRLEKEKTQGQNRLEASRKDLAKGQAKLQEGERDYGEESTKAQKEFDQAEMDIKDAQEVLKILKRPMYTIYSRLSNPGVFNYLGYTRSMDAMVKIFPLFFFAISMLVSLTTMARMVEEHRVQMGTLKALGFNKEQIAQKFYRYGSLAALIGGVLGALVGNILLPKIIGEAYSMGTIINPFEIKCYPFIVVGSILIGLACTGLVAYIITRRTLRESAASLMRPKAPVKGTRILLERISPIWKRMTFLQKVTARNTFRYKMRMLMTLAGVMGCMALLVLGFGIYSAVSQLISIQFKELSTYDITLIYEKALSRESYEKMEEKLPKDRQVDKKVPVHFSLLSMDTQGQGDRSISLISTHKKDFQGLIALRKPRGQSLELPKRGALVTEKLARLEGLKEGSQLLVKDDQGIYRKIRVAGILENYAGHAVYMTGDYYDQVMETNYQPNGYLIQLKDRSPEGKKAFTRDYEPYKSVVSISNSTQVETMVNNMVSSLNVVVLIVLVLSTTLALVVLYNLTNINIEERIRELSTVKVLGFYPKEVTAYVYRETWTLTILGIFIGGLVGKLLHWGVLQVVVPDDAMLYPVLTWWNYLLPGGITLFISFLVMLLVHRYLKKVDMVEALKGVE